MSAGATDFEMLLREALAPVEPPADLAAKMEATLVSLTELAQDELESWELSAMRDPRNWVRPAAAAVVGVGAGTALVEGRIEPAQWQNAITEPSTHRNRTARAA